MLRPADAAWIALAAGVVAWDVLADEMLSEAVDRYLTVRPWITRTVVAVTALHLVNALPARVDPYQQLAATLRR